MSRPLAALAVVVLCSTALVGCRVIQDQPPGLCTEFGLANDDPRAHAELDPTSPDVRLDASHRGGGDRGRYHLFTQGIDWERPVGLLVRLHGDGAEEFTVPEGLLSCLAAEAASHNMVLLAPLTPDRSRGRTWWSDLDANLDWLESLVDSQTEELGIDPERVWWMGYSGGAEMISYGVLAQEPRLVTGGALLVAGGGAPRRTPTTAPASLRQGTCLQWVVGAEDDGSDPIEDFDALSAARAGSASYAEAGYEKVGLRVVPGEDHLSLPQSGLLDQVLGQGCPLGGGAADLAGR